MSFDWEKTKESEVLPEPRVILQLFLPEPLDMEGPGLFTRGREGHLLSIWWGWREYRQVEVPH